jgi:putative tricarboxylic transport membrane protein
MRVGEIIAAAFWLAVALGVTASGYELGLGTLSNPGSGLMIFWVGAAMTALSLATLAVAVRQPAGASLASLWEGLHWWRVPYVSVLLAIYAVLLPFAGYLLCTFLLLFILFKTIEPQGWGMSLLISLASTITSYLVFHRWLGTQLPEGVLAERLPQWTF